MKKQVQEIGVRRWFGNDWISMQNEIYEAMESFFRSFGSMIINGCVVSDNGDGTWMVSNGIVGLWNSDASAYHICRVTEQSFNNSVATVYASVTSTPELRDYKSGGSKNIAIDYKAQLAVTNPGGNYLLINQAGNNKRFQDAIQSASYRFTTDSEKSYWNAKGIPVSIGNNTNLNDLVTPGMYYCGQDAIAATLTNAPTALSFSLLVERHAGVKQTLTTYTTLYPTVWFRNYYNGSWGAWKKIYTEFTGIDSGEITVFNYPMNFIESSDVYGALLEIDDVLASITDPSVHYITEDGVYDAYTRFINILISDGNSHAPLINLPSPVGRDFITIKSDIGGPSGNSLTVKYEDTTIFTDSWNGAQRKHTLTFRVFGTTEWVLISKITQ